MEKVTGTDPSQWVDLYGDYLYRYALVRLQNKELAEDTVQETFVAALQSRSKFSAQSSERTWLTGILKHKILDLLRKKYRDQSNVDSSVDVDDPWIAQQFDKMQHWNPAPKKWANPDAALEEKEFWEVFHNCIQKLPQNAIIPFTLRILDELPYEEICKTIKISTTNLGIVLYRARLHIRRCLENNWFQREYQ